MYEQEDTHEMTFISFHFISFYLPANMKKHKHVLKNCTSKIYKKKQYNGYKKRKKKIYIIFKNTSKKLRNLAWPRADIRIV